MTPEGFTPDEASQSPEINLSQAGERLHDLLSKTEVSHPGILKGGYETFQSHESSDHSSKWLEVSKGEGITRVSTVEDISYDGKDAYRRENFYFRGSKEITDFSYHLTIDAKDRSAGDQAGRLAKSYLRIVRTPGFVWQKGKVDQYGEADPELVFKSLHDVSEVILPTPSYGEQSAKVS